MGEPKFGYRSHLSWCFECEKFKKCMSIKVLIDDKICQRSICLQCLKDACAELIEYEKKKRK